MQLLKITSIPIEYQIQIESAKLQANREADLGMRIKRKPSDLQIQSRNIKVRMDTVDMRSSLGLDGAKGTIEKAAQRGKRAGVKAVAQYVQDGNQMEKGVSIKELVANRMLEQPGSITVFLPSTGPSISWEPAQIQMKYNPTKLNFDWQMLRNSMEFVPGKFQLQILQYPRVDIEYLGEPNYVPPSANPNVFGGMF